MSGGHFGYEQRRIDNAADQVKEVLDNIESYNFDLPATKDEIEWCYTLLKTAAVFLQRVDWLLSGDDGEESFHERLKEDLERLND